MGVEYSEVCSWLLGYSCLMEDFSKCRRSIASIRDGEMVQHFLRAFAYL